jgi:hypothetical protein
MTQKITELLDTGNENAYCMSERVIRAAAAKRGEGGKVMDIGCRKMGEEESE